MKAFRKSLVSNIRPGNILRVGVLVFYAFFICMAASTNVFADEIERGSYYELSNKEISKRHFSFLIQGSWGKTNAAQSLEDKRSDPDYNRKAAQWMFVPATGGAPGDWWIVNRATGQYLAQTDTNKWDVDVAGEGAHGSVWTAVLNREGTHYKFINKASGFGLFQADWGNEWDAHVWKDSPDHDAYLWQIQTPGTIPTVTIVSVKCIHPSTGIDAETKLLFKAIDTAVILGVGAATAGGSTAASMWTKEGMKVFVKSKMTKEAITQSLAEAAAKEMALKAGNAATGESADSLSELAFTKFYGESPDDLVVYVNGIKRWPDVDSRDIKSQQTIKLDLTIPYDLRQGFVIELKDYDYGSEDDGLGWMYWAPEAVKALPNGYSKVLFESRSEGSVYVVELLVGEGFEKKK